MARVWQMNFQNCTHRWEAEWDPVAQNLTGGQAAALVKWIPSFCWVFSISGFFFAWLPIYPWLAFTQIESDAIQCIHFLSMFSKISINHPKPMAQTKSMVMYFNSMNLADLSRVFKISLIFRTIRGGRFPSQGAPAGRRPAPRVLGSNPLLTLQSGNLAAPMDLATPARPERAGGAPPLSLVRMTIISSDVFLSWFTTAHTQLVHIHPPHGPHFYFSVVCVRSVLLGFDATESKHVMRDPGPGSAASPSSG